MTSPPRSVEEWAHELVEVILSAVERWTRKPILFPGPVVARTVEGEEEPVDWLERTAKQRLMAYAAEQVVALLTCGEHQDCKMVWCIKCIELER
jgi:hypothetical protein